MNKIERVKQKYPFLLTNDNTHISLLNVSYYLTMYNSFSNDSKMLKMLGLENYKKDLSWIMCDIKKERKLKLEKLKSL